MNKRYKISILIVIILVSIGSVGIYLGVKYKKEMNLSLNLEELNEQIYDIGSYEQISMIDIDNSFFKEKLQIDENEIEEYIGKIPLVNIKSSMYLVIKSKPDNTNEILKKVQKYGDDLENEWKDYLAEQYYIVKNREVGKLGNYVYMIVSYDAENILDSINEKVQ